MKAKLLEILLCIAAAGLLLAATPGFGIWPCVFLGFMLIHWIFDRKRIKPWKAAFIIGFIYYSIGISWISVPMTLFGGAPQIAGAGLVLLTGLVGAVWFWVPYGYVMGRTNNYLLGALLFVALEMMKGKYLFGGLPWLNIGLTQFNNPYTLQIVSAIGEHGLSFLIILAGGYMYRALIHYPLISKYTGNRYTQKGATYVPIALAILIVLFGYGWLRLTLDKLPAHTHTARMVQTGIMQEDKWDSAKRLKVYEELLRGFIEAANAPGDYDLMILPESSFTTNPFTNKQIHNQIAYASRNSPLLIGYDRRDSNGKLYNDMAMVLDGKIEQNYDKMRLAPFGEYFPFEKQLYPIRRFFFGDGELFTAGTKPEVFVYKDMKIAPLICFEGVFSDIIRPRILMGANVLVLISNDAWFGQSLGRVQHMEIEAVRAVEYGRYMLRTTQDGISAVINPHGYKEVVFPEKKYYFKDVGFSLRENQTPFTIFGYSWYALLITAYGIRLLSLRNKERKKNLSA